MSKTLITVHHILVEIFLTEVTHPNISDLPKLFAAYSTVDHQLIWVQEQIVLERSARLNLDPGRGD